MYYIKKIIIFAKNLTMNILVCTLAISCVAAFFIMLISKLGIRDSIIENAPTLLSKLFACDFCLSWWTSLAVTSGLAVTLHSFSILVLAIIATPITRKLIL